MLKSSLETLATTSPKKFIANIRAANARITELESRLAVAETQAATLAANPPAAIVPVKAAPAPVVEKFGRELFVESCRRDAEKKPKAQSHPELRGRERFTAATKISYK